MKQDDFSEIWSLWKDSAFGVSSFNRELKEFTAILKLNPTSCFVVEENNKIVGSIFGSFNGRRAWINHLCIHPEFREMKYGSELLKRSVQALKERGATKIVLGVGKDNLEVAPFYEKNGFKIMDDAVLYQMDLYKE